MNIILAALKKVGDSLQAKKPTHTEQVEHISPDGAVSGQGKHIPEASPARTRPARKSSAGLLLVTLAVLIGFVWYTYKPDLTNLKKYMPKFSITKYLPSAPPAGSPLMASVDAVVQSLTSVVRPNTETKDKGLNIQGIMESSGAPVALINNNVYEQGGEIDGFKILAIGPNSVTVSKDGQEQTIRVHH